MRIFEADHTIKKEIDNFYKKQDYHSDWSQTERAFVCTKSGEVVGVVKVELINNVTILRGMYVKEKLQKMGIGSQLLQFIEPVLNERTAYCMPLKHVTDFYKQIGFVEVANDSYPYFLQVRCKKYRYSGYVITTMRRNQVRSH